MAYRLRSREQFIPNGFVFIQPETGWRAPRMVSFSQVVAGLIANRQANPHLMQKHGWSVDPDTVSAEVDAYNANLCAQMGWSDYIMAPIGEPPPPKSRPPSQSDQQQVSAAAGKVKKIWSGVRTLNDWIDSGEPAVPAELATARAAVCAACPKNGQGDFTKWFTQPAGEAIKRQMEKLAERKLTTPHDEQINICDVCLCPLKLKVHTPMQFIKTHMSESVFNDLKAVPSCWIVSEMTK